MKAVFINDLLRGILFRSSSYRPTINNILYSLQSVTYYYAGLASLYMKHKASLLEICLLLRSVTPYQT